MERIPIVYLETSLFGFYFDSKAHNLEKRQATQQLFSQILKNIISPLVSTLVVLELSQPHPLREKTLQLLSTHSIPVYEADSSAVDRLAHQYLERGALSQNVLSDARHVAAATLLGADILVSLNLKHLVNAWRIPLFQSVNLQEGHQLIQILSPQEVIYYAS